MTRPDAACLCIGQGIHAAVYVQGEHRERLLAAFHRAHTGPGHIPEQPPRDWYGKEAALNRHLAATRTALQASQGGS